MLYMGEIFKEIRQGRNISLKEATGGEFSYSMLSRFENGESDISATKLLIALDHIHLELEEFFYLLRGYEPTEMMILQEKIWEGLEKKDLPALQELYRSCKDKEDKHSRLKALVVKGHLLALDETVKLTQSEEGFISDYLFSNDIWGLYELDFFASIAPLLDINLYYRYTRELLQKSDYFKELYRQRRLIHTILLNGLFKSLDERAMTKFAYFDKQLQGIFFNENETYFRLIYRYIKGMALALDGKVEKGVKQMEEVVAILRVLDCQSSATYYQESLDKWRKEFE